MENKPSGADPVSAFYKAEGYRPQESLGWLVKRIMQSIVHAASKQLAGHGLTHGQWQPLMRLRFGCSSSAAALAKELDMDAGAMTRLLDRLEAKGLTRRQRSSSDRRIVMVELTEEGQRLTDVLPEVLSEVLNAHLAGFSHEEWQLLLSLLRRVLANGEALRDSTTTVNDPEE